MSVSEVSGSLEVILKVACFDPFDMGLNVTLSVKNLPGFIVLFPPPVVSLNIDASGPMINAAIERLALPSFWTSKEADLLFFTFTFPKS
jgi:hypothetical protein